MDGDGVPNAQDISPEVASESHDIDGDGIADDGSIVTRTVDIISDQSYLIKPLEIVRFVPVSLANGGSISTASVYQGRISIVDNTLVYAAPLELPQQLYIEYIVTLPDGSTEERLLLLVSDSMVSSDSPRFIDVSPKDIQAVSLFTPIRDLAPEATDVLGNPLPVSLDSNLVRLRPGNNVVYWRSKDSFRNTEQVTGQLIRIFPMVDFGQGLDIYEGTQATVSVHLNGKSPTYPVIVPVVFDSISSTSDENDHLLLAVQNVVINSGREGKLVFDVVADNRVEGAETLTLLLGDNVNKGPKHRQVLTIQETPVKPNVRAQVIDSLGERQSLLPKGSEEPFYLEVVVSDSTIPMELYWSHSYAQGEKAFIGVTMEDELQLLPSSLATGRHRFDVEARPLDTTIDPIISSVDIRVIDITQLSLDADSDNDGIPDQAEGLSDTDGDLIPDYLDAVDSCELQIIDNERAVNGGFVLQSSAGSCVMLGMVSEQVGDYSPYVEGQDVATNTAIPVDDSYTAQFNDSDLSNFVITNVLDESVSIVLPLMTPYSERGVFRKYTEASGWFDFDTSEEGSELRYAKGELGFCPPPGADDYQVEPLMGANCLEVTIKDGGIHDSDGERNGTIDDPAYMVYAERKMTFSPITVSHDYDPLLRLSEHEIEFDVCEYIDLVPCNIELVGFETLLGLPSSINGTDVTVVVPAGESSVEGRVLILVDGMVYQLNTTILLLETFIINPEAVKVDSTGGATNPWLLWLLLVLAGVITLNKMYGPPCYCNYNISNNGVGLR
ncbi:thrombospondin type 3 repeat-containing protein [Photobacterium leiognathi]|uniref:thrombospondin type 3 repeat-containing protein n=1 Tax=Photobacterium leiognathi TaxID=553611 RepID=UPI0027390FAD|nr:thrombospondin type 3 repeat-containing protein [Photobacterium leiognathi]